MPNMRKNRETKGPKGSLNDTHKRGIQWEILVGFHVYNNT